MRALFGRVVLVLILLLILKNVYSLVGFIEQEKVPEEMQLVDISYISKPSLSAIHVLCRAHLGPLYFKITCPALDNEPGFENNDFDISKFDGKCKSTDNFSRGHGCSRIILRIPWKQIENFTNFTCFCRMNRQVVENAKHKASVKIINQECKTDTETVYRRKINEEKNIHISCCITGHPSPQITWYKDKFALNMVNGSTVINNVRYQQKGSRLVISRTDLRGSGNYHCLARNTVGYERGGSYQVIFYESKTNTINGSKQQNVINATHFTAITHIETTEMANIFPSLGISSRNTSREPGAYFIRNTNKTIDNKEEAEENEKQNKGKKLARNGITVAVICFSMILLVLCLLWIAKCQRKKHLSTENTQHSRLVTTRSRPWIYPWPVVMCGDRKKSVETQDDSIHDKLVNLDQVSQEPIIAEDIIKTSENSNFKNCQRSPEAFIPSSEWLLSIHQNSYVTTVVNPMSFKIDEALLTHSAQSISSIPSVSSQYCSSSIEDTNDIFAEPCTFSPVDKLNNTELSVDITSDDSSEVSATNLGRTPNMPSPDLSTISNTSELLDKMITIPPNADQRYFASSLIDHNGGEIILTGTGIKLIIPEGAIDVGKTEVVYLALVGNSEYIPKELNDDETLLTPVVMCGPHGLRFKKYVLLIVPHCVAVSDELERKFRVLCSDTEPEIAPDWKEVFNVNEEPNEDVFCYMGEQHFSLFLLHFSWYAIPGEGSARNFSVAAYHTSLHQPNEDFKVRVYFIPISRNSSVGQQRVDESEKKLQGTLSDGQKIKIFHKKGGDIKVEAIKVSEGWQLIDENIQTEGYKELCYCLDESPNRTFRFQHGVPRPERISCKFTVFQDKCKFDTPVDISVSLHFESEIKRAQSQNNSNTAHGRHASVASSSGYAGSGESTTVAFIPTRLRKDLIELLDRDIAGRDNWKMLAEHLGYKLQFIQWLDRPRIQSPTERLLMEWENDVTESPEDALRNLQKILWEMKRHDASTKMQTYFNECSIRKETTV